MRFSPLYFSCTSPWTSLHLFDRICVGQDLQTVAFLCRIADFVLLLINNQKKRRRRRIYLKILNIQVKLMLYLGAISGREKNKTKPLSVAVSSSLPKPARFASEHCATLGGEGLELLTLSIKRKADRRKHNAKHTLVEGFLQKINYLWLESCLQSSETTQTTTHQGNASSKCYHIINPQSIDSLHVSQTRQWAVKS